MVPLIPGRLFSPAAVSAVHAVARRYGVNLAWEVGPEGFTNDAIELEEHGSSADGTRDRRSDGRLSDTMRSQYSWPRRGSTARAGGRPKAAPRLSSVVVDAR